MTEKRFELHINPNTNCFDIKDKVESQEKNAICIYNDLGVQYFSSAPALCELLNELNDENNELKKQIQDCEFAHRTEMAHHRVVEKELKEKNQQLKLQLSNISAQRDEFYRGARENANRVGKLKKENEQLKIKNQKQENLINSQNIIIEELENWFEKWGFDVVNYRILDLIMEHFLESDIND